MGVLYLTSQNGIVKILEEVFNIIAFSCVASVGTGPKGDAFLVASVGAFVITLFIILIRVLNLDTKVVAPWSKIEFFYCLIWSLFYLITAALVIDLRADAYIAGGSFGLFAIVVYLVDAFIQYKTG